MLTSTVKLAISHQFNLSIIYHLSVILKVNSEVIFIQWKVDRSIADRFKLKDLENVNLQTSITHCNIDFNSYWFYVLTN